MTTTQTITVRPDFEAFDGIQGLIPHVIPTNGEKRLKSCHSCTQEAT